MDQPDTGPGLPRSPRQALGAQLPRGLQPGPEHADPRFSPGSRPGLCGQDLSGGQAGSPEGGAAARRGRGFCRASALGTRGRRPPRGGAPQQKGGGTPGRAEPSPTAPRCGTQGWGVGDEAKRERREIGACSAGPGGRGGGWRRSGRGWRYSARVSPAEAVGPPRGAGRVGRLLHKGQGLALIRCGLLVSGASWFSGLRGVGVMGAPTTIPARPGGAPAGDGLGNRHPASWAPSSQGNGGRRGSSAPQGESRRRVGSGCAGGHGAGRGHPHPVDAGWAADKERQLSESQGAADKETSISQRAEALGGEPPGVPTARVETLRLSGRQGAPHPPPAGNPHSKARGQAWTGAASLRGPQALVWTLAAPEATLGAGLSRDPGPPLRLQLRGPRGAGNRELQRQ